MPYKPGASLWKLCVQPLFEIKHERIFLHRIKGHVIDKTTLFKYNFHVCKTALPNDNFGGRDTEWQKSELVKMKLWTAHCVVSSVLSEVRKREHYEKPSVRRKKKSEAARKRKFKA